MVTGDGAYIKKINRSLLLQKIIENGMISRAELSKQTGLNKATVSVQVLDLLNEKLIIETQQEHNSIGRRPIILSINGKAGYILGIDLDFPLIQFTVTDIAGKPVEVHHLHLDTDNYEKVIDILVQHIKQYEEKYSESVYGLINVVIGIHGTVNNNEMINFVPKFKWHKKKIKEDLLKQLDIDIHIDNNANLSAFAEKVFVHHYSNNLLNIILSSGIGAGIIMDGKLNKGYDGYAGEMGHMIISPNGKSCSCGNHGCWEKYASEPAALKELQILLNKEQLTYSDVRQLLDKKDPVVLEYFKEFIMYLTIGINNIINIYNPEIIVLNSDMLKMYPNAIKEIESNLKSSVSQYREIVLSKLGNKSCVLGACAMGIKRFFEIKEVYLELPESLIQAKQMEYIY